MARVVRWLLIAFSRVSIFDHLSQPVEKGGGFSTAWSLDALDCGLYFTLRCDDDLDSMWLL